MHPSVEILRRFAAESLPAGEADSVRVHLQSCELCREAVTEYRRLLEDTMPSAAESLSDRARTVADRLFAAALRGAVIEVLPLADPDAAPEPVLLAADGAPDPAPEVRSLATMYSEDPEVVLRVMRDLTANRDYVQIIADNPALAAHVMVRVPEIEREFVTDEQGRAPLEDLDLTRAASWAWQIKLPEAVFDLESLEYDPDRTVYTEQTTLETGQGDRIRVEIEGKTEGKEIRIELLELDGSPDFGEVSVGISGGGEAAVARTEPRRPVAFRLKDKDARIKIRLFR